MEINKYIPKIRFHNYKELWKDDKLKNIFGTIRNAFVGTATPYYVEKGNFYLESNNVKNGKINYNSQIFINDEFYEKQRDKWLKTNDIVMVQSGHVGHTAVIPEELNNTAAHALIVFTDYNKEVNPHFLNYQFQSNGKRKELDLISTGNTIKHILASEMKNFKMDFPTVDEQTDIGSLFSTLDDLLASYKDNLTNYQSLKATMLSKMFPKAGQTVPEIRLDGFEGEWEIKKFKSIGTKRGKSNSKGYDYPAYSVSNQSGLIPQVEQFEGSRLENLEKTSYKIVEPNEFAYNPARINVGSIAFNDLDETVIVSSLYVIFSLDKSINNNYALLFIKSPEFNKEVRRNTEGSVREYLFYENFANIRIPIPPSLEEQQAIGTYFSNLDNLINSHQEKITQLETLKKKLLQDMFI